MLLEQFQRTESDGVEFTQLFFCKSDWLDTFVVGRDWKSALLSDIDNFHCGIGASFQRLIQIPRIAIGLIFNYETDRQETECILYYWFAWNRNHGSVEGKNTRCFLDREKILMFSRNALAHIASWDAKQQVANLENAIRRALAGSR